MKGKSKRKRQAGAWLLALAMVLSLVMVPAGEVKAADSVSVEKADDSTKPVYVEIKKTKTIDAYSSADGTWPTVELSQYDVIVHNNSGGTISDWTVTITCSQITNWNTGWNGAQRSGNTITIGTYKGTNDDGEVWDNATIENGETGTGAGFQIATTDMADYSVSLTYKAGESSGTVSQDDTATDPAVIGTTSSNVTASIKTDEISGEYHAYYLQVNNNLDTSIGDWIVVIPLTGVASSEQWGSWAKVKTSYTSQYLYLTPSSDGVIKAGETFGSTSDGAYKFNYKGSSDIDPSKAVVYYKTGESASGAFDAVVSNAGQASGGSSGGGGDSGGGTFDGNNIGSIDTSLDYNFAKLLQYSLYFYDANMCGDQVSETSLYSADLYKGWRGDCHTNDKFTYNGKTYSAVGGYHDAGDHVKFGMPMAEAFSTLGLGYLEFGEAFDELGQTQHFKTIMDYYCAYVKSCTVLNAAGDEAEAFCYQVGHGGPDHASWCAPEIEDETATERSFTLVATASNPATEIVAETAAALAIHYLNFGNPEDLKYAKALFAFTMKHKGNPQVDGDFYGVQGYKDDYCLAAAMLYQASKDAAEKAVYKAEFEKEFSPNDISTTHGWANVYQAAALYAPGGNADYLSKLNSRLAGIANGSKTSYYCEDTWGSARINCNVQLMMMIYDKKQGGTTPYPEWAKYQMSMILGNNSIKKNLICGYNNQSPAYPHHRAASGYSGWPDYDNNKEQRYTLYGALVGGPTSSDFSTYKDGVKEYITNEVTLDYNSGLVGAAAALYLKYKNSEEEGFSNQKINADFYGGANFQGATGDAAVTGVTVTPSETKIGIGGTKELTAAVKPANAANKKVTWASHTPTVATVDAAGKVTGVANGTAVITATTEDGGFTASCSVTVEQLVTEITLNKTELALTLHGTNPAELTATVKPDNALNKQVLWSSKDETVATVDDTGKVTAKKTGNTIITVAAKDGSGVTADCTVTVTNPVESITLGEQAITVEAGASAKLTAEVTPSDADDKAVTWTSNNTKVATVDKNGTVVGVARGSTTITATAGGKSADCEVTVVAANVTVSPEEIAFQEEYGYGSAQACKVILTNSGDGAAVNVSATLKTGKQFQITGQPKDSIAANDADVIVLQPETGLKAGKYEDELIISYGAGTRITVPVSFTVSKRRITVTADNKEKYYRDANPKLTYTITSEFVAGDEVEISCATDAKKDSDAGTYPITVTADKNDNYDLTLTPGTLTIAKKPVRTIAFPVGTAIDTDQTLGDSLLTGGDTDYGTFEWKTPTVTPDRGSYTGDVVLTLNDKAKKNYDFSDIAGYDAGNGTITGQVTITVMRAGLPKITWPTAGSARYGDTLSGVALNTENASTQYGEFAWSAPETVLEPTGKLPCSVSCKVVFRWNDEAWAEYQLADDELTVEAPVDVTVEKQDNAAKAEKPLLKSRTATEIRVEAVEGVEFSLEKDDWSRANTTGRFTGLNSFTAYQVYARVSETDTVNAGPVSEPLTVYTLAVAPYTIDVEKLSNAEYISALRENGSAETTVDYDAATKTLTLTQSDKEYTITGNDPGVTIKVEQGVKGITLNNATIGAVGISDTSMEADDTGVKLVIEGSNKIAGEDGSGKAATGIKMLTDDKLIISGGGTLEIGSKDAGGITNAGTLVMESGTVIVKGAVGVDDLVVKGGSLTVEEEMTSQEIRITGGTVNAEKGMESKGDVTISGGRVTATGTENGAGISGENVTISGDDTKVTAAGAGTGAGIWAQDTVSVEGGEVNAAGGDDAAAIVGEKEVSLTGGTVNVTAGKNKDTAIDTGTEGKIIWEDAEINSDDPSGENIFSKAPVNGQNQEVKVCVIRYITESGSQSVKRKSGTQYTVDQEAPDKEGHTVLWVGNDGRTYKKGDVIVVQDNMTLTATYYSIFVTAIKIQIAGTTLEPGSSIKATASVLPENALDKDVEWSSSDMRVATVNEDGIITANAAGTAVITAAAADGSGVSDSVTITVVAQGSGGETEDIVQAVSMTVTAKVKNAADVPVKSTYKLAPKKSMQLSVAFLPANAEPETLTYTSSNPKIATVSAGGKVTAKKKAGKTKITVTAENGLTKTFTLQVMKKAVSKVKINGAKSSMKVNKTMKLKAAIAPGKATASNNIYWKSSNTGIATVDAKGKVKALKKGTVKITAVATDGSGKKATVKIKVK